LAREQNRVGKEAFDGEPEIYPVGFLPVIEPTVVDASGTVGVRGVLKKWTYDVSGQYGHNSFAFTIGDSLNVSLGSSVPPNKTEFDAGTLALNQFVGNVDVSRLVHVGRFAGPVSLAIGAEYRRERYQILAGEPDSYRDGGAPNRAGGPAAIGAQVFPGFRPANEVDASRSSVAGYVDVEGDVIDWLRLGVAGRSERYSDFGSTVDGKVTARVRRHRRFMVRGAVSTGFRAPSLGQSFFSSTATNFLNLGQGLVPVESLTLPVGSAPAQALGAQPLKPERSLHTSAGVVLVPLSALDVTVDYYRISIDDRIVLSGNFTAPPIAALLAPFGANSARFFTNAIDTRTNGVDVTARYQLALPAAGDVQLRAVYNNTRSTVVGAIATPPQLAAFASVLFDRIERRRIECGQPQDGLRLGGDWRRKRFGLDVDVARYGEFCSFTQNPADDQTYAAKWLTDAEASYRIDRYTLAVGAQNLFDTFPDRNTTVNSFNGIQTFPSHSPFGMNGRAIYARMRTTL
jgi:iron complex outermembrane recepter protein